MLLKRHIKEKLVYGTIWKKINRGERGIKTPLSTVTPTHPPCPGPTTTIQISSKNIGTDSMVMLLFSNF